jgi:hypothetical protein
MVRIDAGYGASRPGRYLDLAGRLAGAGLALQNSATGLDLGVYAIRSYSLMRAPNTARRLNLSRERSAAGWSGRGGRSRRLRCGRHPL